MSSSFLEKVYEYIKDNSNSTTTTDRSTGWSTSTSTSTVSKTANEVAAVPLMKLNDNQVNSFERIITATYT